VFAQAAGFAVLAALSPTALLVMAVFLGSANPRTTALLYVAGATLMTVVMAVAVLFILRGTGLNQPREHAPRYGLRLGLGILALASAAFVARRRRREPEPEPGAVPEPSKKKPGLITRLTSRPRPATAFAVGLILFVPSATFIAAVQVVATARAAVGETVLALVEVVLITVLIVLLPLLTFLAAPEATGRRLASLNAWLRANGRVILISGLAIGGVALVINGAIGLAGR
jgi:Sap, sulfolipid-1-addressing protein